MIYLVAIGGLLLFVAAQGAAIVVTAFLALRILGIDRAETRAPAIMGSYFMWVIPTVIGYTALGYPGGFGQSLALSFTALLSTAAFAGVWALLPAFDADHADG